MSRGKRVLDQGYVFKGKHYLPGPGGFGVVDLNGNEVEIPADFPKDKLERAQGKISQMEAEAFRGFDRPGKPKVVEVAKGVKPEPEPEDDEEEGETDYAKMSVDELTALCAEADLDVKGTGANGKILKKDLIKALSKADEA